MTVLTSVEEIPAELDKQIRAMARAVEAKVTYSLSNVIGDYTSSINSATHFDKSEIFLNEKYTDPNTFEVSSRQGYTFTGYTVRFNHEPNEIEVVQILKQESIFTPL